jgi:hypothetical protein
VNIWRRRSGLAMPEYIEREEAVKMVEDMPMFGSMAAMMIDTIPAADVVAVKHGRWIGLEYDGYADGYPVYDLWECSECGEEVSGEDVPITHPYCHGCGAKMDGGEAE